MRKLGTNQWSSFEENSEKFSDKLIRQICIDV
ncbi:uncharacterized protein METZ01_LOCUS503253 [marine metagenome]|uniref:Uncharacterized protein n=1 Tax=marine metagenome TaxID=408172 RepID=A0A383E1E6_9ZZZZ